jgi:hypothetical protein
VEGKGDAMIDRRMPISWSAIQALHEPDLERHWMRCRDELGLNCPLEVFEELFFEHHGDAEFGALYRAVDWSAVAWTETELSGLLLRRVAVERGYQYAVDEARARTLLEGLSDARDAVVEHWLNHSTWLRPPILVSGDVTGSGFEYELLVGFTRLGNLLGLLDRQEVPEMKRHRVWVGEGMQR